MLSWIREKFGKAVIGGIVAFIAFVFVFYGVFSPKSTRGLHEGSVAGTVNGDSISISDFNRELNRRIEFFKAYSGGKLTDDQLKNFRIREGVFQELANRKLLLQEAKRRGMLAPDEEVRERIREISAFQKDGKFDLTTYKQVLEGNNHSPSSFEKLVREDISLQQWESFFHDRVRVADEELKREFLMSRDKRNIKYVLLTIEATKKSVPISSDEIKKFLVDPSKINLVKMKFEEGKETVYKGQKFEAVQEAIARSVLAGGKVEEIQKINQNLADQVLSVMTADRSSDAKVNALLKNMNIQVKSTGLITRQSSFVPGVGESKELISDAFAEKSPIDSKLGGKPKKYLMAGRVLLAVVTESQKPNLAEFDHERDSLMQQISARKSREIYQDWMQRLAKKAKIETNPAVVGASEAM